MDDPEYYYMFENIDCNAEGWTCTDCPVWDCTNNKKRDT